ncbi:MAG: LOG family protein [Stenotrophomonas sp.]
MSRRPARFGKATAEAGWRLVYGGGGVGLMGASARAAHEAGGRVVGIMPAFLRSRERLFDEVETVVVTSMHERKQLMYDQSDVFVVAPGRHRHPGRSYGTAVVEAAGSARQAGHLPEPERFLGTTSSP